MSRRRELADAADGITGRLIADSPERPNPHLARIANAASRKDEACLEFDLLDGTVAPPLPRLRSVGGALRADLARHLEARGLPLEWVRSATLRFELAQACPSAPSTARVQLRIVDDRETAHTSTRSGGVRIPRLPFAVRALRRLWRLRIVDRDG